MAHDEDDDDEYFLPLEDQRVFGAGIKRKRVPFVGSSTTSNLETINHSISAPATTSTSPAPSPSSGASIGSKYLSIVLSSSSSSAEPYPRSSNGNDSEATTSHGQTTPTITCDICNLPLAAPATADTDTDTDTSSRDTTVTVPAHPHESSLAHQVCLPHSHPPSAIDRRRTGYKYLSSYGWDPDSQRGLGPTGQGIQFPLKTRAKNDTVGLGVKLPADAEGGGRVGKNKKKNTEAKLNVKQIRKEEEEKRRKGERLGEMFYRAEDVQRYLGT